MVYISNFAPESSGKEGRIGAESALPFCFKKLSNGGLCVCVPLRVVSVFQICVCVRSAFFGWGSKVLPLRWLQESGMLFICGKLQEQQDAWFFSFTFLVVLNTVSCCVTTFLQVVCVWWEKCCVAHSSIIFVPRTETVWFLVGGWNSVSKCHCYTVVVVDEEHVLSAHSI